MYEDYAMAVFQHRVPHQVFAGAQEIQLSASVRKLPRYFEPLKPCKFICPLLS